jgi:hypothetical protein
MSLFTSIIDITDADFILDVGGNTVNWHLLEQRPRVILVNLEPEYFGPNSDDQSFIRVIADARRLPFRSKSIDVLFSNSVIEHLNNRADQITMANEVERVGRRYFVQTPDFAFPIEPHFLAPFFHWLPLRLRLATVRWLTPWGWITRSDRTEAERLVREIRLLSQRDVRRLFPDGTVLVERAFGLPKSILAVRRDDRI